ncbi:MAG: ABC transporter substrate-binding protein, partial [Ignavibacteriales bacterium]|nr:ABC transporter substrate-binding protein [Ignavibacteriales bacterium]
KTKIVVILSLIFMLGIFIGCEKKDDDVIKIGANLPLTGEVAVYGLNDKKGMDLALSESDLDIKVEIVYEDNKGTAKDAVQAANKLMNEDVIAIIDDAISGISLVTIPIYEKSKVPLISTGATNPALSGISPYFFRIWNSDAEEGDFAAISAYNDLGKKNVVILYMNSDYGLGLKNVFEKKFIYLGGKVESSIAFEENTRDYRAIINQFRNKNFDLIYIVGYAPQTGPLVKNIREQKIDETILTPVTTEDQKFIELAGEAAEGIIYVFNRTPTGQNHQNFVSAYRNKYNEDPQLLTDVGYDAIKLILMALKNGARNGDEIKNFLKQMDTYEGASGLIKFDENGDVHKPMLLKIVKNGQFEKYN